MFAIGQKFSEAYPPEAAIWCNENGAMIVSVGGGFEIQKASVPPTGKTVNEKIADIEAEYQKKLADLDASLLAALWAGGANEVANRQALSATRQQLTADKTAAITNVFLNG